MERRFFESQQHEQRGGRASAISIGRRGGASRGPRGEVDARGESTTELFTLPDNGTALRVVPNASWKVFSDCAIASFTHAHELAPKLDARNASILLVGDSRTRRLFFRMASMLKQQEIDLMVTNDLRTSGEFGTVWAHHQQEKLACEKDMRTTTKGNRSRDNCFGLCSCSTRVSGVQMFFLWQVDAWFNERVEWAWNRLLAKASERA